MLRRATALMICILIAALCGCSSNTGGGNWEPEEMATNSFNDEEAIKQSGISIDETSLDQGYIGIKADNSEGILLQVIFNDLKYNYRLEEDGLAYFIPIQSGNGTYRFRILKNTTGDKYVQLFEISRTVELSDEFQPFIRPSVMVNYDADSKCVSEAKALQEKSDDELDYIKRVYKYIQKELKYDYDFANSNPKMYYPDLDETLESGMGICFDYSTLAASMFRSQGIPTKVITGYVTEDDLYHAWNMIYVEGEGWITVTIEITGEDWNRIDITFADTGSNLDVTYTDRLVY